MGGCCCRARFIRLVSALDYFKPSSRAVFVYTKTVAIFRYAERDILKSVAKSAWNILKSAFLRKGEERSVVVEELNHGVEITEANVNRREKYVELLSRRLLPDFAALQKGSALPKSDRLMIAASSHHATTVEGEARVKRQNPESAIDEGELDGLLFRALWDFLNRYRGWAAKKMGANELELALANVEIIDVRFGNHHVFNPLGFSGKELTVRLKGTFIPRELLPILEKLHTRTTELIVVEHGTTLLGAVAGSNDFVICAEHGITTAFISKENERAFVGEYSWGTSSIAKSLMGQLAIDEIVAEWILKQYKNNKLSERFRRLVEKHSREEFQKLFKLFVPFQSKTKTSRPTFHFHFRVDLPLIESWFRVPHLHLVGFNNQLKLQGIQVILSKKIK